MRISVALFDSMLEDPTREFLEDIRRNRPRVVAISEDNSISSQNVSQPDRQIAFEMIDAASMSGAKVVVNGSDATDHSAEYIARGAD